MIDDRRGRMTSGGRDSDEKSDAANDRAYQHFLGGNNSRVRCIERGANAASSYPMGMLVPKITLKRSSNAGTESISFFDEDEEDDDGDSGKDDKHQLLNKRSKGDGALISTTSSTYYTYEEETLRDYCTDIQSSSSPSTDHRPGTRRNGRRKRVGVTNPAGKEGAEARLASCEDLSCGSSLGDEDTTEWKQDARNDQGKTARRKIKCFKRN